MLVVVDNHSSSIPMHGLEAALTAVGWDAAGSTDGSTPRSNAPSP